MIRDEISFDAEFIEALSKEFTPDFTVHGIHFGEGDPENGGEHWNFSRALTTEDEGVCTVKEIQQVTIYGGIARFSLGRNSLICDFDEEISPKTGTKKLCISYELPDPKWEALKAKAKLVFSGEEYFEIT